MRKLAAFVSISLLALAAACGGSSGTGPGGTNPPGMTTQMQTYKFQPICRHTDYTNDDTITSVLRCGIAITENTQPEQRTFTIKSFKLRKCDNMDVVKDLPNVTLQELIDGVSVELLAGTRVRTEVEITFTDKAGRGRVIYCGLPAASVCLDPVANQQTEVNCAY